MEAWTILSESGELSESETDPDQVIYPQLAGRGSAIAWAAADGVVDTYPASSFEIRINDGGMKTLFEMGGDTVLHVSDRRAVLVSADVDWEPGAIRWVGDALTLGASEAARDVVRFASGVAGLRDKYHLVAQVNYLSLSSLHYYKATTWPARSLLDLAVLTGEAGVLGIEIVRTSLSRNQNVEAIAASILTRAKSAQTANLTRSAPESQRQSLASVTFGPSGDGYLASLADWASPSTVVARRAADARSGTPSEGEQEARARRRRSLLLNLS